MYNRKRKLDFKEDKEVIDNAIILPSSDILKKRSKQENLSNNDSIINIQPHDDTLKDNNKLILKLEGALEFVRRTTILGSRNKTQDLVKTNGRTMFQCMRYEYLGSYVKCTLFNKNKIEDMELEEKNRVDENFNEESDQNEESGQMEETIKINRWYYQTQIHKSLICLKQRNPNVSPLDDKQFSLKADLIDLLKQAILTAETRTGNCYEQACLLAKYLWERNDGINKIEIISTNTFDHSFVVVNRIGNLHDPSTWEDAWVIDAWYEKGVIFHASEFKNRIKKIKEFAITQSKKLEEIGLPTDPIYDDEETIDECTHEIDLAIHPYPTYLKDSILYPVEYYYELCNAYPLNLHNNHTLNKDSSLNDCVNTLRDLSQVDSALSTHKLKYSNCLNDIKNHNSLKK